MQQASRVRWMQAIRKEVLTTGDVARLCHVAPRTVSKWFDTGKLRGYRIPGSRDRRIPAAHLLAFMRAHGIPLEELDGGSCRVLVVAAQEVSTITAALTDNPRLDVRKASNGFEAGVLAQQSHPHVIVIDVPAGLAQEAAAICRNIKSNPEIAAAKVIAAFEDCPQHDQAWFLQGGFDGSVKRTAGAAEIVEAIQKATNFLS